MKTKQLTRLEMETKLSSLGAPPKLIQKWRERGLPLPWRYRLITECNVKSRDLEPFEKPYPIRSEKKENAG